MTLCLQIIIASTRPGRVGPSVATWFHQAAEAHGGFESELVDLADFSLPVFDEPRHPSLRQYEHEHTRRWSAQVERADAYVLVTPEYNFGPTPALLNALNYLSKEWHYKPCAFVSYGGISGGIRAVQMTKQIVTTLKMMPILEGVIVPFVAQQLKDGVFTPNDIQQQGAGVLLNELQKWTVALRTMR